MLMRVRKMLDRRWGIGQNNANPDEPGRSGTSDKRCALRFSFLDKRPTLGQV